MQEKKFKKFESKKEEIKALKEKKRVKKNFRRITKNSRREILKIASSKRARHASEEEKWKIKGCDKITY